MLQPRFNLRNPSSQRPTTIFLFLRRDRRELKLSTRLSVHPKFWNGKTQRVKKSCPEFKHLNGILDKLNSKVKMEILSFTMLEKDWSFRDLKFRITGEMPSQLQEQSFTGFFQSFIDSRVNIRSKGTIVSYQNALRTFHCFFKESRCEDHLDAIDMKFYDALLGYLYASPRNSSINNAGKIIKHITTAMNEAVSQGATSNLVFRSRGFKKPFQKVNHIYLTLDEINQLIGVKLNSTLQDECRNLLVCLCFLGIRWGDLIQVSKVNIQSLSNRKNVLKIITQKTGKLVVIPLHPIESVRISLG